jgi:hypothetical protein
MAGGAGGCYRGTGDRSLDGGRPEPISHYFCLQGNDSNVSYSFV